MLIPEETTEERPPFTWALLKDFCNSLTGDQLQQEVIVPQDESFIRILYASDLGADQYNFYDQEYSCTKEDFDPDMFETDEPITFEEALAKYYYTVTPGTNVYLFDE